MNDPVLEFQNFFNDFLRVYLTERDLGKTFDMFDPELVGFGTGLNEEIIDHGSFTDLLTRDITDVPSPIKFDSLTYKFQMHSDDYCSVNAKFNFTTEINGIPFTMDNLRLTALIKRTSSGLKFCTYHLSMPYSSQLDSESFPLVEIREKYLLIQKLADEKTLQLRETNEKLDRIIELKDKLFSIIAHDLKNPSFTLMSYIELLKEASEADDFDEIKVLIGSLDKAGGHFSVLIKNILEWSYYNCGKTLLKIADTDVHSLFNTVISEARNPASAKSISITSHYPEKTIVKADTGKLTIILRNLISNSIKFTNPGGKISVSCIFSDSEALFSVRDDGIGIPDELVRRLFNSDNVQSSDGTANEKGTGLGLTICRDFVAAHGGKIAVRSKEGEGSEFYFTIPVNGTPE